MARKIFVILFLVLGIHGGGIASGIDSFEENKGVTPVCSDTDQRIISAVGKVMALDASLKNTYSYQILMLGKIIGEGALDYSIDGLVQMISTVSMHYAPQFLYPVCQKFLPETWSDGCRKIIGWTSFALHGCSFFSNPIKHLAGYATGGASVFLAQKMMENKDLLSKESEREVMGIVYFMTRELGWNLHDIFAGNFKVFGGFYAFHKDSETNAPSLTCQSNPFPPSLNQTIAVEPVLSADLAHTPSGTECDTNMDYSFKVNLELVPQCMEDSRFRIKVDRISNQTAEIIASRVDAARKSGKNIGVIMGEMHSSCSCYLQKRAYFKLFNELGIKNLYLEGERDEQPNLERLFRQTQEFFPVYSGPAEGKKWMFASYAYAKSAGLNIKFAEDRGKSLDWTSKDYFEQLSYMSTDRFWNDLKYANEKIKNTNELNSEHIFLYELLNKYAQHKKCPDFFERDNFMIETFKGEKKDFFAIVGAAHLGKIYHGLHTNLVENKNFEYFFLNCANHNYAFKIDIQMENLRKRMEDFIQDPVCLREFDDAVEKKRFYFTSGDHQVHRTIIDDSDYYFY